VYGPVVAEARLREATHGLTPEGDGWFVLNARESVWYDAGRLGEATVFENRDARFGQLGVNLNVLEPGEPMSMYHWEADQEDFLVLSGEALLVVEGEERPLRRWDLVHCPRRTAHVIVGAGSGPCVVLAVGAREDSTGENWGGYPVDETARKHGAGVDEETTDPQVAYAPYGRPQPVSYRDGLLP
jgi:uncharacterized cupin superfamily protein